MAVETSDATATEFTHFVSIDFGTSGCGIAMATMMNKSDIKTFTTWEGMNTGTDVKCPTVLLLNPSGKFESFGRNAITTYEQKKENDNLLFQKFKMHLYDNPDGKEIEAMNGKKVPLIKVFELSLKYIKEEAIKGLRKNFENPGRKIQWVITVPAIWSPAAKQTMRNAAKEAGFDEKSLVFALEPEAAAFSCLQDLINAKQVTEASYLVVDCGGGTVDIAAHKMAKDEKGEIVIHELAPPCGGNYGGFAVNEEFESMLQDIIGLSDADFKAIKEKHARHWMKMVWIDFEESKCSVKPGETNTSITISVHKAIRNEVKSIKGEEIKLLVEAYKKRDVEWDSDDDSIVLPYSTVCSLYRPALTNITHLIEEVLSKNKNIKMVLLVGGFAESALLYDEVKESLTRNHPSIEVKRSLNPVFSVAIGAVIFGFNKNIIKSRVMKHSVGVEACVEFQEGDDPQYVTESGGQKYRSKAFWHLVKAKQSVYTGVPAEYIFRPLTNEQNTCVISIYESSEENVKYITDVKCQKMGTIEIEIPKCTTDESREIKLVIDFAKTEYNVLAFSGFGPFGCTKELTVKPTYLQTLPNKYLPSV